LIFGFIDFTMAMAAAAPQPVGGYPAGAEGGDKGATGHGNLVSFIDKNSLECRNQWNAHPVANAFDNTPGTWLQSDPSTDSQLLISIGFRLPVKISAVRVTVPDGAGEEAPAKIKIFTGKDDTLDFDDAETRIATAELDVEPGVDMPVRFVKFQNISYLSVFVPGSVDELTTKIQTLTFIGSPESALDMKDWKPIKG